MSKSNDRAAGGLMSSAGLSVYTESEKNDIAFEPLSVMLFGILVSLVIMGLNVIVV